VCILARGCLRSLVLIQQIALRRLALSGARVFPQSAAVEESGLVRKAFGREIAITSRDATFDFIWLFRAVRWITGIAESARWTLNGDFRS
jgi:hypothetical protein